MYRLSEKNNRITHISHQLLTVTKTKQIKSQIVGDEHTIFLKVSFTSVLRVHDLLMSDGGRILSRKSSIHSITHLLLFWFWYFPRNVERTIHTILLSSPAFLTLIDDKWYKCCRSLRWGVFSTCLFSNGFGFDCEWINHVSSLEIVTLHYWEIQSSL